MCVFFSPFVLFLFPLSPLPGVQPGSISLFCPIFDAMFSRYDIIPPPHASTVEAGVFCCGLGFGGVFDPSASDLGVTLSSSWIPLEFAKGSSPYFTDLFFFFSLFFCTIQYLALRDARNVPTSQGACFWKWSRPLWDSPVFIPTSYLLGINCSILVSRDIWSNGMPGWLGHITAIFLPFFLRFALMMNVCPLGSDDPIHFL